MTISSVGYNGGITAIVWPLAAPLLGQQYFVPNFDQVTCTPVANGTRQVTIGTGSLGGMGVLDSITQAETLTLGTVSSQTNWYMIAARRTWQSTNATSLVAISAGNTANAQTPPTTLPTRNTNPGVIDDQPLWLVPLTVNDTVPGTPISLRVLGTAGALRYIQSTLSLQYLNVLGAEVVLNNVTYRHRLNATGTGTEWYASSSASSNGGTNGWNIIAPVAGFVAPQTLAWKRDGERIFWRGSVRFPASYSGGSYVSFTSALPDEAKPSAGGQQFPSSSNTGVAFSIGYDGSSSTLQGYASGATAASMPVTMSYLRS